MDVKNLVTCILLTIVMIGGYAAVKHFLKEKLNSNISSLLWCIPFIIYGFAVRRTAFWLPQMENTEFIPYVIGAVALEAVLVLYCGFSIWEDTSDNLYHLFIRPVTLECIFSGILMPALFFIPVLFTWMNISFVYVNGAVLIVSLLQVALHWFECREEELSVLELVLELVICMLHALIIVFTGSILITVILRIGYALFMWKKRGRVAA